MPKSKTGTGITVAIDIQELPVGKINPAPYNPRKDLQPGDVEYEKIKRSIGEFGCVDPLVWNKRTGNLVGGHQRFKVLVSDFGAQAVPVSVVDITPAREKALNVALNKTGGEWDDAALRALLAELAADPEIDATVTGFEDAEIEAMLRADTEAHQDDVPPVPAVPVTQPGDVWLLGPHRLACGDSTSQMPYESLFGGGGVVASMVLTDPPYNVGYVGKTKDKLTIQNDALDDLAFGELVLSFMTHALKCVEPGGAIYCFHPDTEMLLFRSMAARAGWLVKLNLIWVKNTFVFGRQDYHWQHELIMYGWRPGAAHNFYGGRNKTTVLFGEVPVDASQNTDGSWTLSLQVGCQSAIIRVPSYEIEFVGDDSLTSAWRCDRPARSSEHPTMKPVKLLVRAIENSTRPGEIILEPFCGSGSTLIAAHQTGRVCYGIELDPKYVDVTLRRFADLTGESPTRESDGARYTDLSPPDQSD